MRRILVSGVALLTLLGAAVALPEAQARTETITLRSKPFRLSGFETQFPKLRVPNPRRTGYLTGMRARLVTPSGRGVPLQQVMLHHIVFLNDGRPGGPRTRSSCKGRGGEPFWGTGEERQPLILPGGYGYRIRKNDRWRMQVMLMSHNLRARRVQVEYRVQVTTGRRLQRVKPLWLRANGCTTHPSYDIGGDQATGPEHRKSHLWRMPLSGRIVAASAHLHGGAKKLAVTQPRCANRELISHLPLYGHARDAVYRVRPVLHEPGPIAVGQFVSPTGLPIRKGEFLRVTGLYDARKPRPRVMAITHIYVAAARRTTRACAPRPRDARTLWTRRDGTFVAPEVTVPLHGLDEQGRVREISRPPGEELLHTGPRATIRVRSERFGPPNLSVAPGTRLTWRFEDREAHNVTFASGPRNLASPNRRRGQAYSKTVKTPGEYRLFCYLHPVTMQQVVKVREPGS